MALKYTSEDKGASLSDLLIYEIDRTYSREEVTLSGVTADLPMGSVLKANTDGSYSEFAAAEGETAAAVLMHNVLKGRTEGLVFVRGVVLNASLLAWKSGMTDANKQKAVASLKTVTIIAK